MPEELKPRPFSRKWITVIGLLIVFAVGVVIDLVSGRIEDGSILEIGAGVVFSILTTAILVYFLWFRDRDKDD